jgi:hypothetical protein
MRDTGDPLLSKEGRLCRSSECNVTLKIGTAGVVRTAFAIDITTPAAAKL